ncbi:MAG: pyrroline-5-carboxylate reductase [Peptostreptococcaceae bacterium]|nr:pyrroline-5-carboxylate reductase [Peptostreptococcaceae bacterium]
MNKKIGFIGCGNMAKAMIVSIIKAELVDPKNIFASDGYQPSLDDVKTRLGIHTTLDNKEVVKSSDVIFLAVKPNMYDSVMQEVAPLGEGKIFVSIAPGKTLDYLENGLGKSTKILRTMPNTPAMVGEGVTAICPNKNITPEDQEALEAIIGTFGIVERIDEKLFDSVVAVSGSSPAYVFMFIEAMADAAVLQGMARDKAYRFAAQAVLGSAKMVLETKKHPGDLKDMVCSPGGTTIEGVAVLEEKGMRSAVIQAMNAVYDKSGKM